MVYCFIKKIEKWGRVCLLVHSLITEGFTQILDFRFPFGFLFIVNGLFQKKIQFTTLSKLFFQIHRFSWCLACFSLQSLHQKVLNGFLHIFSEGFLHLSCIYHKKLKKDVISTFQKMLLCFVFAGHVLLFTNRRSGAVSQKRMNWYISNPFWDSAPSRWTKIIAPMEGNYYSSCLHWRNSKISSFFKIFFCSYRTKELAYLEQSIK